MGWPLSQDYNEAIQSPARNFVDPDLRSGEVAVNALGLPLPCSGNFADVYQIQCPDGSRWAVKCFTREVPGLRQRYEAISRHLRQARLPFTVDFSYLEQGIRVAGKWFPVLKMQWVAGLTLNQFVGRYADKPAMLEALLQIWVRLDKYLRGAQVGHCDLQHGNVLLVPGASTNTLSMKLVDYDGMWVPALAGQKSGEVGHPSYQHPQRSREQIYSLDVDRFPLLLIATALRAVTVKGRALWEKHDNGDNLLFTESDLAAPTKSFLFLDLVRSADPLTEALADHLLKSLRGGLASVPHLEEVIPELPAATTVTRAAPKPVAIPVVARPKPVVIRRPRKKMTRGSAAAWVVAILLLLAGVGALAALYQMQEKSGEQATGPNLTQRSTEPDPGTPDTRAGQVRPVATQPDKEETKPIKATEPDKPIATAKSTGPVKSKEPAPKLYVEKSLTNSIDMRLVGIEAGRFRMGSPSDEVGRQKDEGPQHEVRITQPFYMSAFPVTKGKFALFVKDKNYKTEAEKAGEKLTWRDPGFEQGDNEPVVMVTWHDAVEFCKWLSEKDGHKYALPTEAQWEYACRAGTTTAYFFGDDPAKRGEYAWFGENAGKQTHVVGEKLPNRWRLYDMYGNVRQWCRDGMRTYTAEPGDDPLGPDREGADRVLRGGDFNSDAAHCRSAARMQRDPSQRTNHSGFRVVRKGDLEPPK